MEDTTWSQKLHALTHILTNPTTTPSLHSQFFIATQIPCYLNWDYPPILCSDPSLLQKWKLSHFLKRLTPMAAPKTSWRSRCPYHQPPPLILAKGVKEAQWGNEEETKGYARKRLARRRFGREVNPLLAILVPNAFLLALAIYVDSIFSHLN